MSHVIASLACTPQEGVPPCTGPEEKLQLKLSLDCPLEAVLASSPRARLQYDLYTFTPTCHRLRIVWPDAHGGGRGNGATRAGTERVCSSDC